MTFDVFPLFPGVPGGMELAVILLIAILLFGANKIPKLARSTGEAMGEFKKGRQAVEQELQEMRDTATMDDTDVEPSSTSEPAESPVETEPEPEPVETESEVTAETDER